MTDKNSFFVSHDFNARSDERILELRVRHGFEGYGLYWALIEIMGESTGYQCSSNAVATLAYSLSIAVEVLQPVIDSCLELGLFITDGNGCFYSESLRRRMDALEEKRLRKVESGRKGGLASAAARQRSSDASSDAQAREYREDIEEREKKDKEINSFARFWSEYPKKKGKGDAEKAWKTYNGDSHIDAMLKSLKEHKLSRQWIKDGGDYIPYPAKWIRGKHWLNEVDLAKSTSDNIPRA